MWEELKSSKGYRQFRKKDTMYILHFIAFSNKEGYMMVNENAFDVPAPEMKSVSKAYVKAIYGISL